jgi:hypothetical protein
MSLDQSHAWEHARTDKKDDKKSEVSQFATVYLCMYCVFAARNSVRIYVCTRGFVNDQCTETDSRGILCSFRPMETSSVFLVHGRTWVFLVSSVLQ